VKISLRELISSKSLNEVARGPPGGLQISNTRGPPMTRFRQLSNLDRLCAVHPQYRIDLNGYSSSVLAVDFAGSLGSG